jgi:hypothetical protein
MHNTVQAIGLCTSTRTYQAIFQLKESIMTYNYYSMSDIGVPTTRGILSAPL